MEGRNVFISFLGISNYSETKYLKLDGEEAAPTCFVQEVLFDSFCTEWKKPSKIFVICTKGDNGSYSKNWVGTKERSLQNTLSSKKYFALAEPILLDDGVEQNLWTLFERVYALIQDNDIIHLDVTNAFRSFPTLATTLLAYARFMRNATIGGIYYGMYDKSFSVNPIIDLTAIVELQEYVNMANGLTNFGRLNGLADAIKNDEQLEVIHDALETLDQALLCNIGDILREGKFMTELVQKKKLINKSSLPKPVKDTFSKVITKLSDFKAKGELDNFKAAALWNAKYHMYPQAYALGKEYVNRVVELKLRKLCPYHKGSEQKINYLLYLNRILTMKEEEIENSSFDGDLLRFYSLTNMILSYPWVKELRKVYPLLNDYRNGLMHVKKGYKYEDVKGYFQANFEKCISILDSVQTVAPFIVEEKSPIFINFSNHPTSGWSQEQLGSASEYGRIVDLEFPKVDENADEQEINRLVDDYMARILMLTDSLSMKTTVHIMGEMTFTFAMIRRLKDAGCECLASTTERLTEELPDGRKVVTFAFKRFRKYC